MKLAAIIVVTWLVLGGLLLWSYGRSWWQMEERHRDQ